MNPSHPPTPRAVATSLRLFRALLGLYPAGFRRAYGDEIVQVFAQECRDAHQASGASGVLGLWLRECGDLLVGAGAERLAVAAAWWKGSISMSVSLSVYRQTASAIFAAFVAYVLAGIGFQKMSEEVMKSSLPASHPLFTVGYGAVEVGAVLALLAILVGGVPIALAALRDALAKGHRDVLLRFAVPPISLLVLAGYFLLALRHSTGHILGWTLVALFVLAAAASTAAVLDAIQRSDVDPRLFRSARTPGAIAALAMLLTLAGSAAWSLTLWQVAPGIFFGNDGVLATSTLASTIVHTTVMLVATAVALGATVRSRGALA
jgi:hypothetical protein